MPLPDTFQHPAGRARVMGLMQKGRRGRFDK